MLLAAVAVWTTILVACGGLGDRRSSTAKGSQADPVTASPEKRGGVALAGARIAGAPVMDTSTAGVAGQRYIVTLVQPGAFSAEQIERVAEQAVAQQQGEVLYVYTRALRGFSAVLTPETAERLRESGRFSVVPDEWVEMTETQPDPPSWGLDRIDGTLDAGYRFDQTGAGVNVYVLDTGIRLSHHDFGNRADTFLDMLGGDGTDRQGHGTHVAGTVGGATFGVAKQVAVHSVRVLDPTGLGRWSDIIQAIDSVIISGRRPAVINMSLGGPTFEKADTAVQRAVRAGITVVVAAGNDGSDACDSSPAREPLAITVGATTRADRLAGFSNRGACVDILAPGDEIISAGNSDDTGSASKRGTSMASPHVAGAAALFLQTHVGAAPADVARGLTSAASRGKVQDVPGGTPNLLLQTEP
jgi:subtilisin family serine protease